MDWNNILDIDPLPWLLETDPHNPGIRYFALKELMGKSEDNPEVIQARKEIMESGPVPVILNAQEAEGYWVYPGAGYTPKYKGTVWQIMFLSELGADPKDNRIVKSCEYLMSHSLDEDGAFSCNPKKDYSISCLNGNLIYAMQRLGFEDDPRIRKSILWMASSVINPECTLKYCGYKFACLVNDNLPCAWGMVKALKAFSFIPEKKRSSEIKEAINSCTTYLNDYNIAKANYPPSKEISKHWFNLGFPFSYWSDFLENATFLAINGALSKHQIQPIIDLLLAKRDKNGFWRPENRSMNNRMWLNPETRKRGSSSKWVTLRVLRFFQALGQTG
ncbi:MAG: hypothetical protein JEZ06_12405 [Anaerolineaceae bacterium]|nr:hypothetical protein [Anaerolineaceae bacterium]